MAALPLLGPRGSGEEDGERHEHRNATETLTAWEANTAVEESIDQTLFV